jgi:hypothetical protein
MEELELERKGRVHNHRERERLTEELEWERLARSEDKRNVKRLEQDVRDLQQALEAPRKSLWTNLLRNNNH